MERRQYPRLTTQFPAELDDAHGGRVPVTATNVSLGGLQVLCDRHTALRIAPNGSIVSPRDATPITVRVTLPLRDGTHVKVEVRCRPRVLRRIAAEEYRLGLEYELFNGHSYQALEAFIDDWTNYDDAN
jgi:hypothetical protein